MLTISLNRYKTGSTIIAKDGKRHLGTLSYTRKIHEYESESDFKRIVTQLKTYGDNEALEEFSRIQDKQNNELRARIAKKYEA